MPRRHSKSPRPSARKAAGKQAAPKPVVTYFGNRLPVLALSVALVAWVAVRGLNDANAVAVAVALCAALSASVRALSADGSSSSDTIYAAAGDAAVENDVEQYTSFFSGARKTTGAISTEQGKKVRAHNYGEMVDKYYTLVTDFYEYGWGQSFHFAPRFSNESFAESIVRAEHYLASRLGLTSKMRVLDVGCGVGGPLRNIARFSGAAVEGDVTVADLAGGFHLGNAVRGLMPAVLAVAQ